MAASMKVIRPDLFSKFRISTILSPASQCQLCANCLYTNSLNSEQNINFRHFVYRSKFEKSQNNLWTSFKGDNLCGYYRLKRNHTTLNGAAARNQLFDVSKLKNGGIIYAFRFQSAQSGESRRNGHLTSESLKLKTKENVWTIPNLLTMSRIVMTPVIGYLVMLESYSVALGLFAFAGITDLLDGYIARNVKNQMSAFGTALDPLADKILITVLTVTLTLSHLIPVPLAVLIIGRDILLIASGFIIRFISLPPPKTIKRYFDVTMPTVNILPTALSKINTALQLSLVCVTLAAPVFNFVDHQLLQCLWYITGATTLGSGVDYVIRRKKCVQFLQKNEDKSK
ncbi:cardiolipin synthase [Mactra antiquata]